MAEKPWEYYTGPHLAQALRNAWDLVSAASNFTDAADVRDYQQYGTEASRALLNRDWQGLGENAPAALASGVSLMLPGIAGLGGMVKGFHGTPYRFKKFDSSKIGTGEGAQAYGHGLYVAGGKGTGKYYRDTLSNAGIRYEPSEFSNEARDWLESIKTKSGIKDFDADTLLAFLDNELQGADYTGGPTKHLTELVSAIKSGRVSFPIDGGSLYHVNIDVDAADLLDWDKPLSEQSGVVSALKKYWDDRIGDPDIIMQRIGLTDQSTGRDLYEALAGAGNNKEAASRALNEAGIPGIKYLDAGSRSAGEGTHNYVIFDDSLLEIVGEGYQPKVLTRDATGRPMTRAPFNPAAADATLAEIGKRFDAIKGNPASGLPMDEASRMARAREMGFDVDGPMYHGTVSENIWEFSDNAIGSAHDTGHYGRGHYFADTPGEASYYGPNVGEYVTNAKLLDLSNKTGDYTFLGHFKSFAPKLDAIGALDPDQKKALAAVTSAEKYVDENIEFLRAQGFDGKDGWMARVKNPAPGFTDKISTRVGRRGEFPATKDEAREALKSRFLSEMQFHHPEIYPGLGDEHASLSDYVRTQFGAGELTEAAKRAGYEGIKYGSETVIFDPKKIRSTKAKFDPANKDSADLLASWAAALGIGGLAAGALAPSDAKAKERR